MVPVFVLVPEGCPVPVCDSLPVLVLESVFELEERESVPQPLRSTPHPQHNVAVVPAQPALRRKHGHAPTGAGKHATAWHATPRHATPRHATPCHATPRHATPRHATPRHAQAVLDRLVELCGEVELAIVRLLLVAGVGDQRRKTRLASNHGAPRAGAARPMGGARRGGQTQHKHTTRTAHSIQHSTQHTARAQWGGCRAPARR